MKLLFSLSVLSSNKKSFQICDNHEVLATNQWCKPNAENELARAMLRRRPLMPNGNGSPKGQRNARSNLCAKLSLAAISAAPYGACGVVGAVAQGFR